MNNIGLSLRGEYRIMDNDTGEVYHESSNIITNTGVKALLDNFINNKSVYGILSYIQFGTGTSSPSLSDTGLSAVDSSTKTFISSPTVDGYSLSFTSTLNSAQINNHTELGVYTNNGYLVSHDTFTALSIPYGSTVKINYVYSIGVDHVQREWEADDTGNVYKIPEVNTVKEVYEDYNSIVTPYTAKTSKDLVSANNGSYWYDSTNNMLYVNPYTELTSTVKISDLNITMRY